MSERPTNVGGFIGLEGMTSGKRHPLPHPEALFLTSGRACMARVLDHVGPQRMLVPFYTCNSLLAPARDRGVEIVFLPIDEQLHFLREPKPQENDLLVLIDHFGVRTQYHLDIAVRHQGKVVLDLTHSFFTRPGDHIWAFNSARKFFGVPDGGFLYAPLELERPHVRNEVVRADHLILRTISSGDDVLMAYRANEARMTTVYLQASLLSEGLLGQVDVDRAQRTRLANFQAVHETLGGSNLLQLTDAGISGPLCYPFLAERDVDLTAIHKRGIFAARYWPDLDNRPEKNSFPLELSLSRRLVAIPIDHRYSAQELVVVARELIAILAR
jgi:hypothetical protein